MQQPAQQLRVARLHCRHAKVRTKIKNPVLQQLRKEARLQQRQRYLQVHLAPAGCGSAQQMQLVPEGQLPHVLLPCLQGPGHGVGRQRLGQGGGAVLGPPEGV